LKPLPGHTRLCHQRNPDIREGFEVATDVSEEMQGYQQHLKNWERMQTAFQGWLSATSHGDDETDAIFGFIGMALTLLTLECSQ
jgi:hypothetical protein